MILLPDFTSFIYTKDGKQSREKDAKLAVLVEWKEHPQAVACLLTAPDGSVWRITTERVENA
jgi:hypothetical protein